jgi:hypothetical protein
MPAIGGSLVIGRSSLFPAPVVTLVPRFSSDAALELFGLLILGAQPAHSDTPSCVKVVIKYSAEKIIAGGGYEVMTVSSERLCCHQNTIHEIISALK